ncbi:hypothetical protein DL762_006302 [Monosporascus cannonballus]|uniref:Afadin and alpha-actinin-binding-domain-containing protein n=1 Tax=Monosporascus cannonballus TaxID=155416 RepID=A0ABY0H2H0_9PEZI|nr:hypothetical protein DL762_006302 [Monosporascus cannonballus]
MIGSENLRTASLYINNQLLSRGLLRDGQSIDFADPGRCDGGVQATMGKVMSVVNDLILRRDVRFPPFLVLNLQPPSSFLSPSSSLSPLDELPAKLTREPQNGKQRDAEHRESLSSTLRTLRAESQRQATEHQRAADRLVDAQRRLDGAEATERALRAQLRATEGSVHRLKEEAQRTRALVAQTRAACATEVRRRDRQIEGLKRAVVEAGRVRGSRNGNVTTITISGEVGGEDEALPPGATADEAYDLRMETNEFLTRLAGSLSEENEVLRALVRRAVEGLREMSGLEGTAGKGGDGGGTAVAAAAPQQQRSAEELAAELDAVLDHLRTILTNPSFVPIEEVEVRDEEIQRLRAGFERLETRWKDAVVLIDGWRRRMGSGGRSVDVEELSAGLRLSPVRVQDIRETADVVPMNLSCVLEEDEEEDEEAYAQGQKEEADRGHQQQERERAQKGDEQTPRSPSPAESLHLVPAPGYEVREGDENGSESSSIFEDGIDMDELEAEEPNVQVLQESTWRRSTEHSPPLPEPPELSPLKDSYSSGNRGSGLNSNAQPHPKGPGDFTTIVEEKTWELAAATATEDEVPPVPPPHTVDYKRRSQEKSGNESKENKLKPSELVLSTDSRSDSRSTAYDSPLFGRSGEKPSMSDPSKKLFSKPSSPAKEPPKKQDPAQKAKQSDHSKSAPDTPKTGSGRRPQTRSSTKRVASNPNPPPPPPEAQQSSQPSPAPTTKSTASSKSASAQNGAPLSKPTSTAATTTAATQSRNPSPVRNNNATNPQTASSRLTRRNNLAAPPQQQTPLTMETIAAKLAAAEREADAARVRAKLRAARLGKRVAAARNGGVKQTNDGAGAKGPDYTATANSPTATTTSQAQRPEPREREQQQQRERERRQVAVNLDLEDVDPVKKDVNNNNNNTHTRPPLPAPASPRRSNNNNDPDADELAAASPEIEIKIQKRKRDRRTNAAAAAASRRASRRRSTLSPWELESLIQGGVAVESPAR